MYEPIRAKSVHSMAGPGAQDTPHRSREEELDARLAGHFTALLTVTDELRVLQPDAGYDDAAQRLAAHAARLGGGRAPLRAAPSVAGGGTAHVEALHQRAHRLAGNALVIAVSRGDEAASALAGERLDAHASVLGMETV